MLTFESLKIISSTDQASVKAKILADVISKEYIRVESDLYKIDEVYMTLELIDRERMTNVLIKCIQDIYEKSDNNLSDDQKDMLKIKKHASYRSLSQLSNIKAIIQNIDELLMYKIDENNKNKIHFKNGYIEISTGQFKKRTIPVKNFIDRNYKKSKREDRDYINNIYNQIYPIKEEHDYILSTIASAITGQSKKDRTSLFLIGKSSAGKSLLMQTLNRAFSNVYVKEFASDTFSKNNNKRDKIMNEFLKAKDCRICWVNELSGKIDDSLFKSFCEGNVKTTSLYKDGMNDIEHLSKVILTSNELPNIRIDTGVSSRIVSHTHRSYFTENINDVDEEKYIFLRNNNLISTIETSATFKNAIIDIIMTNARNYLEHGLEKIPESMLNDKAEILSGNDYIQDFIDAKLEKRADGRISKNDILDEYLTMYPNHKRTVQQMISSLKDKGFEYRFDMRVNCIKGCFINVQFKQEAICEAINYTRSPLDIATIKRQSDEIAILKAQILELQKTKEECDIVIQKVITPKKFKKHDDDDAEDIVVQKVITPKVSLKALTPTKIKKYDDDMNDTEKLYISNKQTTMDDMFLSTFNLVIG